MSAGETRISRAIEPEPEPQAAPASGELRLGRMRRLDGADVWGADAAAVAAWLRSDPSLLGEALRLELQPAADTSIEGVVADLAPGVPVIAAARFEEPGDEDVRRLAALVVDLDAGVLVLLAPAVPEPVRRMLDKLNRNTSKVIVFYAVEFELWQIDDSAPAPLFRVVSGPEGWDRVPAGSRTPDFGPEEVLRARTMSAEGPPPGA